MKPSRVAQSNLKKGKGLCKIGVVRRRVRGETLAVKLFGSSVDSATTQLIECDHAFCPLSRIKAGTAVRIKQLSASPDTSKRLREIGFCEEQIIRLVTSQANFICQVCNARLAISAELAQLILVEPVFQRAA